VRGEAHQTVIQKLVGNSVAGHMEMSQAEGLAEGAAHIGRVAGEHGWAGIDWVHDWDGIGWWDCCYTAVTS
jgi:hypothetical protein